jgi:hypothetical protein
MARKRSITFFACNPEAELHRQLIRETLEEEARFNLEEDLRREQELDWEKLEEQLPQIVPAAAIMDWDFYRGRI